MKNGNKWRDALNISIVIGAMLSVGTLSKTAEAVSYPISEEHHQLTEKSAVKEGGIVYLFHSGTPDVIKAFGDKGILEVFGKRHGKVTAVGKVKVLVSIGEYYLKAEVIEGEIRHDDIARHDGASSLVILEAEILK